MEMQRRAEFVNLPAVNVNRCRAEQSEGARQCGVRMVGVTEM